VNDLDALMSWLLKCVDQLLPLLAIIINQFDKLNCAVVFEMSHHNTAAQEIWVG